MGMETDILRKINGAGLDLFTCSIVRVVAAGEGRKWRRVVDLWVGGAREEGPCVWSLVRSADRAGVNGGGFGSVGAGFWLVFFDRALGL